MRVCSRDVFISTHGPTLSSPAAIADSTPTVSLQDAIATAENALEGKHDGVEPKLEYVVVEDGSAILAHVVQIRNDGEKTWYQAFVDAHSGELKSVVDFYAHATVRAISTVEYLLLPLPTMFLSVPHRSPRASIPH